MDSAKLYRALLTVYPAGYRREFGEEMLMVYRRVEGDHCAKGFPARARHLAREILGLLKGALVEHWRALGSPFPEIVFRRFAMRDGFRFPHSTVVFMTLVLVLIVEVLARTRHIYGLLGGVYPSLFGFLIAALVITCAVVLLGLVLLRALRRTGAQRLEDLQL